MSAALAPCAMQEGYGRDAGIQMQKDESTGLSDTLHLKHRAKFATLGCDSCNGELNRKYFYVWENSLEWNEPEACGFVCPIGIPYVTGDNFAGAFQVCAIPPNCCCPGSDNVSKVYFDRGMFDHQSCCWTIGFFGGAPKFHANEIEHVCCCAPCPVAYDQFLSCYWPNLCGERVRYLPAEKYCWCCSTRSGACTNKCGLCGPKTGEPDEAWLKPVLTHLLVDEGEAISASFNSAMAEWRMYTGCK